MKCSIRSLIDRRPPRVRFIFLSSTRPLWREDSCLLNHYHSFTAAPSQAENPLKGSWKRRTWPQTAAWEEIRFSGLPAWLSSKSWASCSALEMWDRGCNKDSGVWATAWLQWHLNYDHNFLKITLKVPFSAVSRCAIREVTTGGKQCFTFVALAVEVHFSFIFLNAYFD